MHFVVVVFLCGMSIHPLSTYLSLVLVLYRWKTPPKGLILLYYIIIEGLVSPSVLFIFHIGLVLLKKVLNCL